MKMTHYPVFVRISAPPSAAYLTLHRTIYDAMIDELKRRRDFVDHVIATIEAVRKGKE